MLLYFLPIELYVLATSYFRPEGLSSPQLRFTAVFGMGTGVAIAPNHQNAEFKLRNHISNHLVDKCHIATFRVPNGIDGLVRHGSTPYGAYT